MVNKNRVIRLHKLVKEVRNLSKSDKLELAKIMFGCDEEQDNFYQIVLYTGLTRDDNDKVVNMPDEDY